jgi:DNA adenine methylase
MTFADHSLDAKQRENYPSTRFMGSKRKLIDKIWDVAGQFQYNTVIDLFAGSGVVSYMFKCQGKRVISNDHMHMSWQYAKAMIENNDRQLPEVALERLLEKKPKTNRFVEKTFSGLYFSDDDNRLIDRLRFNIAALNNPYDRAIATAALMRACTKKRARGIFTFVGFRYNDGRRDLMMPLEQHFRLAVKTINNAVFSNGQSNLAICGDALGVKISKNALVYMDPPYYSPLSDNEYVRRYHFIEGVARGWKGVKIQDHTMTKKFASYVTPFASRQGAYNAFDVLFKRFQSNILLVSYASNGLPTMDEIINLMKCHKAHVEVVPVNHRYSFGNQGNKVRDNKNAVSEYLFVGY